MKSPTGVPRHPQLAVGSTQTNAHPTLPSSHANTSITTSSSPKHPTHELYSNLRPPDLSHSHESTGIAAERALQAAKDARLPPDLVASLYESVRDLRRRAELEKPHEKRRATARRRLLKIGARLEQIELEAAREKLATDYREAEAYVQQLQHSAGEGDPAAGALAARTLIKDLSQIGTIPQRLPHSCCVHCQRHPRQRGHHRWPPPGAGSVPSWTDPRRPLHERSTPSRARSTARKRDIQGPGQCKPRNRTATADNRLPVSNATSRWTPSLRTRPSGPITRGR